MAQQKITGSFRVTPKGKWEYRIPYTDECNVHKYKSFTADTQEECFERAMAFREKLEKQMAGIDVDASIPDLLKAKIKEDLQEGFTGEQGYDRNLNTIRMIETSPIGNIPIYDITELQISYFLKTLTARYSNNTIAKAYGMLKAAYKIAVYQGITDVNIMDSNKLRCPKSRKRDKVVRGLTEEEQRRLIEALASHKVPHGRNDYSAQILIELYAGLRMGEINALKPENIHFTKDGGFIHVQATVARGLDCRPFIKQGTKTDAGVRDVPISKPLIPVLKTAIDNMKKNPYGLIFYDYVKKGIVETHQVNSFYRRICEKASIQNDGQHALRHTFATRCIESGVPAVVLKSWLGHTDIHITLDTYSDVFDRMNHDAVNKFNEYMNSTILCHNENGMENGMDD